MKQISSGTSTKKMDELVAALKPYSALWTEWILSGASFLKENEVIIITNYLLTGSHQTSGRELNITMGRAASILKKAKMRLKWNFPKFQLWLTERMLEQHGIISYQSDLDRFLNYPFEFLPLDYHLKFKLSYLCEDTIGEILNKYPEKEIERFWFFGKKEINQFKSVLKQNNCLHLLK